MNLAEFLLKITGQADRIAESETKLSGIADQLTAALSTVEAKDAEIAKLKADLELAPKPEAITELEGKVAALSTENATLEAEVAALPEKINAEAARIAASNGHAPVTTATVPDAKSKELSLADFNALSHSERNKFIRTGGKISK